MKKHLLFISTFVSLFFSAQQADLVGNTWYLEKMISVNGTETTPPKNAELPNVTATFNYQAMTAKAINNLGGHPFSGNPITDTTINFDEWYGNIATNCQFAENCTFEGNYFHFFIMSNPHQYTITNEGNYLRLTLTNSAGQKAVYRNYILAVTDSKISNIQIYPNPVKDILNIKYDNSKNKISGYELIDLQGNILNTKSSSLDKDNLKLDISNLSSGNYVLILKDEKNNIITSQKVIKK